MSAERDSMIDAAVRVYGDDVEKTAGARAWLQEVVPAGDDAGMKELESRFDALDRRAKSLPWRRIYLILSIVIVAGLAVFAERMIKRQTDAIQWIRTMGSGSPGMPSPSFITAGSPERRLLLGDPSKPRLEQKAALWDSDPENPAFFAEYAAAFFSQHNTLPPDYFETASRLDPDNAWFDYYGAAVTGYKSVRKLPRSAADKQARKASRYEIVDRPAYERALEIISRAASKPKLDSYERHMMTRRMMLLPQASFEDHLASTAYLLGMQGAPYITLMDFSQIFCARVDELQQAGDIVGVRKFAGQAKAYMLKISEDEGFNLVTELVVHASIAGISQHLVERGVEMGIAEEFPWASEWYSVLEAKRQERLGRKDETGPIASAAKHKGGFLVSTTYPMMIVQSPSPPPLADDELKPGRLADYSLLSIIGSGGLRSLLVVAAVVFLLYRFRTSSLVRLMAQRTEGLLSRVDWLWILGGGVLLPVLVVYSLMFFTPLGSWDTSARLTAGNSYLIQPFAGFLALGILMIIVPLLVARWRLRKKAAPLGFRGRDITGWCAVGALLIFATSYKHVWPYWVSYGFGAVALLWLVVVAGRAVFSGPTRLLPRVVLSRIMLPVCATCILVVHASIFGFQAARQHWFERDELTKFSADEPGLSKYEYRVAKEMRRELNELLDKHR